MSNCDGPNYNSEPPERPRDIPPASISITPVEPGPEPLDDMGLPEGPPTQPFVYPPYRPPLHWTDIAKVVLGIIGFVIATIMLTTVFGYKATVVVFFVTLGLIGLRMKRGSVDAAEAEIADKITEGVTPSKRISKGVYPGEQVLWEGREHPISMLKWMSITLLVAAATLWIGASANNAGLVVVVWLILAIGAAVRVYMWDHDRLAVTNKRLLMVTGIFTTKYPSMPLSKLTDESLILPWHGKLLAKLRIIYVSYGTILVESAGQDQALRTIFVQSAVPLNKFIMERVLE